MTEKLINCTPHAIDSPCGRIEPSGTIPRVEISREYVTTLGDVPVYRTVSGEVSDLPGKREGTYYIVSRMVAMALPERDDLIFPDQLVRDDEGRVVGLQSYGVL